MKDSKKYSKKLRELHRSLKRGQEKGEKVVYDEPVDAIVYAIVSENISEAKARTAMKRILDHFVDFNDLRASRPEEIIETLGEDTSTTNDTASSLAAFLEAVFNKYNMVTLSALKDAGKRPARQALEKIEGLSRFAIDYCMLTSLQGHAIPVTERMIRYLKDNEIVHSGADEQEIGGFLARQISAENAYDFYSLLRSRSETRKAGKKKTKKKTVSKAKAKPKAKAKKKTKKSKK